MSITAGVRTECSVRPGRICVTPQVGLADGVLAGAALVSDEWDGLTYRPFGRSFLFAKFSCGSSETLLGLLPAFALSPLVFFPITAVLLISS